MTHRGLRRVIALLLVSPLVCLSVVLARPSGAAWQVPVVAVDQEALARAKALYASAEFEAALQLFQTLRGAETSPEAESYQAYCLVALGRKSEARQVIEKLVQTDPLFHPPDGQLSPHLRAFFDETRKPLLQKVARQSFNGAKTDFDHQDMPHAISAFERVIAMLDEIGPNDPDVADLRALSVAFRDFARVGRPEMVIPNPNPAAAPAGTPTVPIVYDAQNSDVVAPIPLTTPLPEWRPAFFELNRTFSGDIQLVIGSDGKVVTASMVSSVHPRYDGPLLDAAKGWTFKPAMRNGAAVRYRFVMTVRVLK
jgi:tetratricopeptide (TPR) repeat protein